MHKRVTKYILLILFILLLFPSFVFSNNMENGRVKVVLAFYKNKNINMINEKGEFEGFAYEWMENLRKFTDWDVEYKYFENSFDECLTFLEKGEADLMLFLQKTPQREKLFNYSTYPIGEDIVQLITNPGNRQIIEGIYDTYKDKKIGMLKRSAINNEFNNFSQEKKFFTQEDDPLIYKSTLNSKFIEQGEVLYNDVVWFDSVELLQKGLQNGDVDFIVIQKNDISINYKLLDVISKKNTYVAISPKKPNLVEEMDYAIEQLKVYKPKLSEELWKKYKPNNSNVSYTPEEKAYIDFLNDNNLKIKVSIKPFLYPFGNNSPEKKGFGRDLFEIISKESKIPFEYVSYDSTKQYYEGLKNNEFDIALICTSDLVILDKYNLLSTLPYYQTNIIRLYKENNKNFKKVGVVEGDEIWINLLNKLKKDEIPYFKDIEIKFFKNKEVCINDIKSGLIDCMYLSAEEANYWISQDISAKLKQSPVASSSMIGVNFGVKDYTNPALFSCLNKTIYGLGTEKINELINNFMIKYIEEEKSLIAFIYRNPVWVVFFATLIFVFIILVILFYSIAKQNRMQKEYTNQLELSLKNEQRANSAKLEFISHMSHDMRTPMNTILGLSEFGLEEKNYENIYKYFYQIKESGIYLLGLVNDILNMQKLNLGVIELEKENVFLEKYLENIINIVQTRAKEKNIELVFVNNNKENDFTTLYFDKVRVQQILINIINNAVKYTDNNGRVEFIINYSKVKNTKVGVQFIIKDNGIGISKDFIPKMFLPFEQEQTNLSHKEGGVGLGLSIVKNLVDLMEGSIDVESQLKKGTTFYINLNFDLKGEDKEESFLEEKIIDKILKNKRVLLFEDIEINAIITKKILEKKGMVVTLAQNGLIGFEIFQKSSLFYFDLILMDVRMPVMDGLESTRRIRGLKRKDASLIPIIALSANAMSEDFKICKEAGMNSHLAKPINSKVMYNEIVKELEAKRNEI